MPSTIVLVTGANSGIGFGITQALVQSSSTFHVIIASRTLEKANAAKSEIEAAGIKGTLSALQLDVTDENSINKAAEYVRLQHGYLSALINNAGVGGQHPDLKTRFQRCLETNVIGPALVAAAFRPLLFKSKNPYSIYIGSGQRTLIRNALQKTADSARIPYGDAYPVSKAALGMLAVTELRDHGDKGLKVFVVSPGFVISNLRGPSEEQRTGWGRAQGPEEAGKLVLDIVEGKRDADVGCLVHKDGVYAW